MSTRKENIYRADHSCCWTEHIFIIVFCLLVSVQGAVNHTVCTNTDTDTASIPLTCSSNQMIHVISELYGRRTSEDNCTVVRDDSTSELFESDNKGLNVDCNGNGSCTEQTSCGDDCNGSGHAFEIKYTCVEDSRDICSPLNGKGLFPSLYLHSPGFPNKIKVEQERCECSVTGADMEVTLIEKGIKDVLQLNTSGTSNNSWKHRPVDTFNMRIASKAKKITISFIAGKQARLWVKIAGSMDDVICNMKSSQTPLMSLSETRIQTTMTNNSTTATTEETMMTTTETKQTTTVTTTSTTQATTKPTSTTQATTKPTSTTQATTKPTSTTQATTKPTSTTTATTQRTTPQTSSTTEMSKASDATTKSSSSSSISQTVQSTTEMITTSHQTITETNKTETEFMMISGGISGGLVVLILVITITVCVCRKRKASHTTEEIKEETGHDLIEELKDLSLPHNANPKLYQNMNPRSSGFGQRKDSHDNNHHLTNTTLRTKDERRFKNSPCGRVEASVNNNTSDLASQNRACANDHESNMVYNHLNQRFVSQADVTHNYHHITPIMLQTKGDRRFKQSPYDNVNQTFNENMTSRVNETKGDHDRNKVFSHPNHQVVSKEVPHDNYHHITPTMIQKKTDRIFQKSLLNEINATLNGNMTPKKRTNDSNNETYNHLNRSFGSHGECRRKTLQEHPNHQSPVSDDNEEEASGPIYHTLEDATYTDGGEEEVDMMVDNDLYHTYRESAQQSSYELQDDECIMVDNDLYCSDDND